MTVVLFSHCPHFPLNGPRHSLSCQELVLYYHSSFLRPMPPFYGLKWGGVWRIRSFLVIPSQIVMLVSSLVVNLGYTTSYYFQNLVVDRSRYVWRLWSSMYMWPSCRRPWCHIEWQFHGYWYWCSFTCCDMFPRSSVRAVNPPAIVLSRRSWL